MAYRWKQDLFQSTCFHNKTKYFTPHLASLQMVSICCCCFCFSRQGFSVLTVLAVLELTCRPGLPRTQRSACLYLPSAKIKVCTITAKLDAVDFNTETDSSNPLHWLISPEVSYIKPPFCKQLVLLLRLCSS